MFFQWTVLPHPTTAKQVVVKISLDPTSENTGGRLNKKDGLTRYGDSYVKDKTS